MSDRIRVRHVDLVSSQGLGPSSHGLPMHAHLMGSGGGGGGGAHGQPQLQPGNNNRGLREAGRQTQQQRESLMNANLWKAYLYELQQAAPTPKRVTVSDSRLAGHACKPSYYGREFHGRLNREEGDAILKEQPEDGRYLVRESVRCPGQYTLSLRFNNITKNYRLHFYDGQHFFASDKKFDTLHDLVADALISLYLELHAGDYIASLGNHIKYEETPYMTMVRKHRTLRLRNGVLTPLPVSSPPRHSQQQQQQQPQQQHHNSGGKKQQQHQQNKNSAERIISVGQIGGQPLRVKMPAMNAVPAVIPPAPRLSALTSVHNTAMTSSCHQTPVKLLNRGMQEMRLSLCSTDDAMNDDEEDEYDYADEDPPDHDYDELDVQLFEKAHNFKVHNFIGLPFCEFCGNFMWGILGQGVKCEDCGFSAHRKCGEKVPPDCCPDLIHITRVFGVDLTTLVKACNTIRPFVVDACIHEIENRGLHVEGLYRVSGFADDVEALKVRLEADGEVAAEFILRACDDVHVITGVLKLYFRLLPIPVITFDSYPFFLSAIRRQKEEDRMTGMREALAKLLPAHLQVLKFLLQHLSRVAAVDDENLMSAYNLSTVFCPTLLRTPDLHLMPHQTAVWQQEAEVVEFLINHCHRLFK